MDVPAEIRYTGFMDPITHILVVDDDRRLRQLLEQYLREQGYLVSTAATAAEADAILAVLRVDAMVLDVMMPGETGLSYAARLREWADAPPVLLLTARGETEDRIAGLEAGAADYLGKPFAPRELLLRLENILRHVRNMSPVLGGAAARYRFGDYRFDPAQGSLLQNGTPIYLTSSEIDCLRLLVAQSGEPVSRTAIAEGLGQMHNERSVDVQINRLRKKIEPNPAKPVHLQTVRHAGYVLYATKEE